MRLILFILFTLPITGCTAYTTAQLHLTDQARKGVAIWTARESARDDTVRQTYAARRKALDAAFDADVRAQSTLDPTWVIESRRAYATALTLLDQSESAELSNNESARRDAAATDDALAGLAWLLQIQANAQSIIPNPLQLTTPKGGPK
jgi:hypothetical protein